MCSSCGCARITDTHNDPRHITLNTLEDAADAAGVGLGAVAANITSAVDMVPSTFARKLQAPVIVCDIDGVLARFADAATMAVNTRFATGWRYQDWTTYRGPFTAGQRQWLETDCYASDAFWAAIAPDTEAVAWLRRQALEHVVVVVSNRPRSTTGVTVGWLEGQRIAYSAVAVLGDAPKRPVVAKWAERSGAVMVDDNPARWLDCATLPGVGLVTPACPWTPDASGYPSVTVVDSWDEVATSMSSA